MYFTYVVRPGDAPEGKGPQFQPFWDGLMNYKLRGGFAMKLIGYFMILIGSTIGGNVLQIFDVLAGQPNAMKNVPVVVTFIGLLLCTGGSLWIQNFRNIADDDSSIHQSRGFRAGLKCLHQASFLDILASAMSTVLMYSFIIYFEDTWTSKEAGSGSTVIIASIARTLHSVALILYGSSFFFLENFHGEGTAEFWGWTLAFSYSIAGASEFLCLICVNPILHSIVNMTYSLCLGVALFCSLLWAASFEILVNRADVKLTQSAMRNEFYKSRNAMAYYGPPSGVELNTMVDQYRS